MAIDGCNHTDHIAVSYFNGITLAMNDFDGIVFQSTSSTVSNTITSLAALQFVINGVVRTASAFVNTHGCIKVTTMLFILWWVRSTGYAKLLWSGSFSS